MILALLCACQLAASRGELLIRGADSLQKIRVTYDRGTPYVGRGELQTAFAAGLSTLPNGRALLQVAGVRFELAHGIPFVRVADQVVPLSASPRIRGDSLAVPLQLVAQVLPRFAPQFRYNVAQRTLSITSVNAVAVTPPPPTRRAAATPVATPPRTNRKHRIVIDAGHGGPDEGTSVVSASGTRITEKSITLAVGLLLGEELRKRNFDVSFTRTRDTLIALQDRGRIANTSEGSAFVSIHVNAAGPANGKAARGVETYFLSVARTEDARRVEALENGSLRFEGGADRSQRADPLTYILTDMKQNDHLRESSEMAEGIQRSLSRVHPGGNRGVKQAEFAVLVGSFMPAVLVEIGFLSNQSDAAFLVKKENQRKIAVALADAMATYFKEYDRRVLANGDGR